MAGYILTIHIRAIVINTAGTNQSRQATPSNPDKFEQGATVPFTVGTKVGFKVGVDIGRGGN